MQRSKMNEVAERRLGAHRLAGAPWRGPADVVAAMGAVQAQDHGGAKWAVGLRCGASEAELDVAFDRGELLRTHVLRPTWHFVAPADLRWLQALTAERVRRQLASYDRKLGIGEPEREATHQVLRKLLRGGAHRTRSQVAAALEQAGIDAEGTQRLAHLLIHAELDAVICSGPRAGKQHTYALVDERVPEAPRLSRDEALAELARRYFATRSPATVDDFAWWSGLSKREAQAAIDTVASELKPEPHGERTLWLSRKLPRPTRDVPRALLLPNYDELLVAYQDRRDVISAEDHRKNTRENILFSNVVVLDGQVAGTWRRTVKARSVGVEVRGFQRLDRAARDALAEAAERYAAFLGRPVSVDIG